MSPASITSPVAVGELVPIAERLRYMQAFRFLLVAVVALASYISRDVLDTSALILAGACAGYLAFTTVAMTTARLSRSGATRSFGFVLILDGVFLAWASYVTGGSGSPVRYLIVLHLIAVALLASYRTGMKLALWHSLLLLVVYYGQDAELLRPLAEDTALGIGSAFEQLVAFSAVFWLVAIVTSSFSAINERELRRRRYDLEALAVMARRLEEAAGSIAVADVLIETVAETFDVERAVVLAATDGGELEALARHGDVAEQMQGYVFEDSVVRHAMSLGATQLVTRLDPVADAALAALFPDAQNLVVVPLSAGKQALGVVIVEHPMKAASRIERRIVGMLERFAAHAALALRNAWLLEEIQHLAATDGLTGIANRATFQTTLAQELSRARRSGEPVGLALLDLDHFKRLNDTHGHQAGDEVLRRVAAVLDDCSRGFDTPARYGGEEFAIVLPHTTPEEGVEVAERLRRAIVTADIDPSVTVSIGVACFPNHAGDADELVRVADEALYASKGTGRNRVTSAASLRSLPPSNAD
jgi:two-component system, cell cycle response regulator